MFFKKRPKYIIPEELVIDHNAVELVQASMHELFETIASGDLEKSADLMLGYNKTLCESYRGYRYYALSSNCSTLYIRFMLDDNSILWGMATLLRCRGYFEKLESNSVHLPEWNYNLYITLNKDLALIIANRLYGHYFSNTKAAE